MSGRAKISIYLALYLAVNLPFLGSFPFVHSDEPWLSGLSRAYMNTGGINVTESFFNLYPRNPHAIKTLFHLLQTLFISAFGYNIFALRLMSLLFSTAALYVMYRIVLRLTADAKTALFATAALSFDIQFIYAAHFARQEIIILFALLLAFYLLLCDKTAHAAAVTGISIGIHPNAFLIAAMCGALLFTNKRELLKFTAITGGFCAFFVSLSFILDGNFISNYISYGKAFEIDSAPWTKLQELGPYLGRIFNGIGGTYYLPDIRFQLALAVFVLLHNRRARAASAVLGIIVGLVLVGRYSQLYIVFIFPFIYILFSAYGARKTLLLSLTILLLTVIQLANILPKTYGGYEAYLSEIKAHVPDNAVTLCNLNAEFAFADGALIDYRNLTYMRENDLSFAEYIDAYGIQYIVLSDELALIHRNRPRLNSVYGNLYYYDEMLAFLESDCVFVHSFKDGLYGMRIIGYQGMDCNVRIYRVR